MAKLYFSYAAMNAGKSTALLQVAYNYEERGMRAYLLTSAVDDRAGTGVIWSRIGAKREAEVFTDEDNLFAKISEEHKLSPIACVLIDEANWLTKEQVEQLAVVVDTLRIPVMCYGLRTDFQGNTFTGSQRLLAIADELREIRTICHCGRKATMILRYNEAGEAVVDGPQLLIGDNDTYTSVCRNHWKEALQK